MQFAALSFWAEPIENSVHQVQRAREGLIAGGDLTNAGYSNYVSVSSLLDCAPLERYLTEVEAALYEHPYVREAAVLGLPHPVMGSMIAAAVVLTEDGSLYDVRAFLRERLAAYKVPVRWEATDRLPRNQMGKVVKQELRPLLGS